MAQNKSRAIRAAVESVLPEALIEELARQHGVLRRQRKLDLVLFIRALVLGFAAHSGRSLCGFRRLYQRIAGVTIARSSFHARFTEDLVSMLRALVEKSLEGAQQTRHLSGALSAFLEVLAIDSSIVRVTPKLAAQWPGAWAHHSPAAVKLTAVTNVVGRDLRRVRMVPGSRHDIHLLDVGSWLVDRLVVFDLGFYSAKVFQHIDGQGGYFLSRLRKAANPFIIESFENSGGEAVGYRLKEWQVRTTESVIDVEAKMTYQDRPLKLRKFSVPFRVVALWHEPSQTWHRYITNAPPEMLPAKLCSAIYASRWEIELLFKELKSQYRIEEFASKSGPVNLSLICAALLTLIVSRRLHQAIAATCRRRAVPHDRWSRLFSSIAHDLLRICSRKNGGTLARETWFYLKMEAPDPNRNRALLAERSSMGVCAFA